MSGVECEYTFILCCLVGSVVEVVQSPVSATTHLLTPNRLHTSSLPTLMMSLFCSAPTLSLLEQRLRLCASSVTHPRNHADIHPPAFQHARYTQLTRGPSSARDQSVILVIMSMLLPSTEHRVSTLRLAAGVRVSRQKVASESAFRCRPRRYFDSKARRRNYYDLAVRS